MIHYFDFIEHESIDSAHKRFHERELKRLGSKGKLSYIDDYKESNNSQSLSHIIRSCSIGDIVVIRSIKSITSIKALRQALKERVHDYLRIVIDSPYLYLKPEEEQSDSILKSLQAVESPTWMGDKKNSPIGKKLDKVTILQIEKLRESGASFSKIARSLDVSHQTVKKYAKNVKIKVKNRPSEKQKQSEAKSFYKKDYSNLPSLSDDMLTLFMKFMLHQRDANTQRIHYYDFKHALDYLGKKYGVVRKVGYFDEDKLSDYLDHMTRTEASVGVIRRRMYNLKSFFKYLVIRGDMKLNPVNLLKLPKITRYQVLTPGFQVREIEKLIDHHNHLYQSALDHVSRRRNHRNLMIVKLLASTGMRVSGIVHLKKKDVVMGDGRVVLHIYRKGKADKQQMVLDPVVAKNLVFFIDFHLKDLDGSTPVFFSYSPENKQAISVSQVNRMLKKSCRELGFNDDLSAHSFRVSFAELASSQLSLAELAKQLDHADIKQTACYLKNTQVQLSTPWTRSKDER